MDFEACGGGDDQIASLGTCSNKLDASLKRNIDNSNSLHIQLKKSKVSTDVDHNKDEDVSDKIVRPCKPADNSFSSLKRDLAFLEKLFKEGRRKTRVEDKRLQSIKREIEERTQELKTKETELRQVIDNIDNECGRKEEELKALSQKVVECTLELKAKEKELDEMDKLIGGQAEELESKRKKLEAKEREIECQMKELVAKQKHFESRLEELDSNEKHFEIRFKEHESREREFECHMKEMESKKEQFERRVNELESKENKLVERVKEFDSKKKEFELPLKELVKKLESKQKHFNDGMKVLESIEQLEGRVKELKSKERELEDHVKDIQSKEEELDGRVREFESNKKHFESQFQNFKSKEKQFEGLQKDLEFRENKFKVKVKELNLKEKQFGGQVNDLESKANKMDRQLKKTELTEKQNEVLTKYIVEEKDSVTSDQLSATIDGSGLKLDTNEKTDGVESLRSGVLLNLLESSDPGKLVLGMILNPAIPLCNKKGANVVIVNDSHINLLEHLMTISPNIKPCVREEALKLALDLKANMKENTENYLAVLGFLLLLSIYGLVAYFIEDEILELFTFVAHYKKAAELFRNLGFANKVSDFVENLIKRKQFVGAVRFSCEYNLGDKNQLVDLLQQHVWNAKQICDTICKNSDSIEIKDKARDQEIAILGSVVQCISDHSLEPKDQFNKEIKCRILELKGYLGS